MAAEDNLSRELFFPVHRGLLTQRGDYSTKYVGQHWTPSLRVAETFARQGAPDSSDEGTIFHANVPVSSVETNTKTLENMDMFSPEKEIPVKKNSKVFLTGVTTFRGEGKKRTRSYNPPREMQA